MSARSTENEDFSRFQSKVAENFQKYHVPRPQSLDPQNPCIPARSTIQKRQRSFGSLLNIARLTPTCRITEQDSLCVFDVWWRRRWARLTWSSSKLLRRRTSGVHLILVVRHRVQSWFRKIQLTAWLRQSCVLSYPALLKCNFSSFSLSRSLYLCEKVCGVRDLQVVTKKTCKFEEKGKNHESGKKVLARSFSWLKFPWSHFFA